MKNLILDLDGTLTIDEAEKYYIDKTPNTKVITKLTEYQSHNFRITISTILNMRTFRCYNDNINTTPFPPILHFI